MDVALSDLLTCPRCGPTHGLVLLPYDVSDRRVRSGVLGCANCRERYPVEGGIADLRAGAEGSDVEAGSTDAGADDRTDPPAVRLAGLMGLAEAHGTVLLAGPAVAHASALSALVEGIEVAAAIGSGSRRSAVGTPSTEPALAGATGVSRLRVSRVLPFRSGSLRGVALTGASVGLLGEGARVLGGAGRLVVDPAPADARGRLEVAGLAVVAEEGPVVVAARRS